MKKLLLILLCLPMIGFGQQTYVPDDNFEQALINLNYDNVMNDSVATSSIDTLQILSIFGQNISSLVGIQDFINLRVLRCSNNQLSDIDLSSNILLRQLYCGGNQLSELDVSTNNSLTILRCGNNPIISLDLSNTMQLIQLFSRNGALTELNIKNGNNIILDSLYVTGNPNLSCIEVNNINYFNNNFSIANSNIDSQQYFSNSCSATAIQEHATNKELLKVTDLLGRETKGTKNEVLFYIYDDGTVEKRLVIE